MDCWIGVNIVRNKAKIEKEKAKKNYKLKEIRNKLQDEFIINTMTKYDHRQHELSDWLLELEQRFQLGEVEADRAKITWCQLLIGATG